jgi:hypothetical protein
MPESIGLKIGAQSGTKVSTESGQVIFASFQSIKKTSFKRFLPLQPKQN